VFELQLNEKYLKKTFKNILLNRQKVPTFAPANDRKTLPPKVVAKLRKILNEKLT